MAVGNRFGVKLIPRLPATAKRLLSGGRAVTIDGNTLDPTIQMLLASLRVSGQGNLVAADDAGTARARFREMCRSLDQPGVRVAETRSVAIPGPVGDIAARLYRPVAGGELLPLVVFYHGGGAVIGDLDTHDLACRLIARDAEVNVLSVDYRLAPEHPAPAGVDDAYAAYRWARAHAVELGSDARRIAVAGDSAGGCLAAVVARLARDSGDPMPSLQWLIYPVTDWGGVTRSRSLFGEGFLLTKRDIDWFHDNYLQHSEVAATDPIVSPLLATDLSGLPPALVITAGFDPLRDEGEQYAQRLSQAGVPVDQRRVSSMIHGFINLNSLGGEVARSNAEMISALKAHLTYP